MNAPLDEFFNGLLSRTRIRQFTVTGPAKTTRISNVADLSSSLRITKHPRLVDTFRFWSFRTPQSFTSTETDWVIPGSGSCAPPACSLLVPISSTTQKVTTTPDAHSFNQNWKRNEVSLVWDASRNRLQPFGSLQYNYYQPLASLSVDLGHNLEAKAGWNYHQYGEKSFVGPTDPRYFHANNATFGLRWAF